MQTCKPFMGLGWGQANLDEKHDSEEDDEDESDGLQLQVVVRDLHCWPVLEI